MKALSQPVSLRAVIAGVCISVAISTLTITLLIIFAVNFLSNRVAMNRDAILMLKMSNEAQYERIVAIETEFAQSKQTIERKRKNVKAETLKPTVFDSSNDEPVKYFGPVGVAGGAL